MEKSLDGPIASVLRPSARWLCLSRKYSCLWCLCSILLLFLIFIIFQTNAGNLFICFMRCSEPTLAWWCQWLAVFCSSSCRFVFFLSVKARKGSAGHKRRLEAGGHGKCRLCPVHQASPVCGSDGHSYSSKARLVFDVTHTHTLHVFLIFAPFSVSPSFTLLSLDCGGGVRALRATHERPTSSSVV